MGLSIVARTAAAQPAGSPPSEELLFGATPAMRALRLRVQKVAATGVPMLIQGEPGTGKEALARLLHRVADRGPAGLGTERSGASRAPFVKVNCAAIPDALLESELFGYRQGGFTGAAGDKPGTLARARGGTIFFDNIAELAPGQQAKLVHLVSDGCFSALGDSGETPLDARVICAAQKSLSAAVASGSFRADLFHRINVVTLRLAPLRERRADIPALANFFLAACRARFALSAAPFSRATLARWQNYAWPGNLRELENAVARYVLLGEDGGPAEVLHAGEGVRETTPSAGGSSSLKHIAHRTVREKERELIQEALKANQYHRRRTATALKISYRGLLYKIREAGLPAKRATQPRPFRGDCPAGDSR